MDAGKVGEKVIVEDGQPAILGQLYVHFDDARAQVVGQSHRVDSILDWQCRILPGVGADSVVSDSNRTHVRPQEILRGTVWVILIVIRFIAGSREAAAEIQTENQSAQPNGRGQHFEESSRPLHNLLLSKFPAPKIVVTEEQETTLIPRRSTDKKPPKLKSF